MAAKFEFRDNLLHLDIAGAMFDIDPAGQNVINALNEISMGADKLKSEAKSLTDAERAKFIKKEALFGIECLDMLLGENSANLIFDGREITYFDVVDVLRFVTGEIRQHMSDFKADAVSVVPANREQRRAATKASKKAKSNEPSDE